MSTINNSTEAMAAWRKGNDAGEGFAPRGASVTDAIDEMLDEPGARLMFALSGNGIQTVARADGRLVGICNAEGAWAVYL